MRISRPDCSGVSRSIQAGGVAFTRARRATVQLARPWRRNGLASDLPRVAYELRMWVVVGSSWCRIARTEPVAATIAEEVSPLDELFFSLDGSTVATEDEEWRLEVSGIHFGDAGRWVQLNLCGEVTYSVTLKIDSVDARAIREDLAACLAATPRTASLPF